MVSTTPILLLASLAAAAPSPSGNGTNGTGPALPTVGAGHELPSPPSNVTLKNIALGFGIQNYTCDQVGGEAAAKGALAMLYDVTNIYPGKGPQALSQEVFDGLTTVALEGVAVPLNFNESDEGRVDPGFRGASLTQPFKQDAPLNIFGRQPLPFLGHHVFNAKGDPAFVLDGGKIDVAVGKLDSADAPKTAKAAQGGTGAVPWLYLKTKEGRGAQFVYRVLTAGGVSHGCSKAAGQDSSSYAAMYWFYG